MEEKKLTDDEIVKALECCEDDENVNCEDCPLVRESCAVIRKYALDLIHRLQSENERLKKRHGVALLRNDDLDLENYELKKQVEKMKADITKAVEDYKKEMTKAMEEVEKKIEEIQQQAVKYTAKEICEMINGTCISSKGYLCSIISKRYGVEVE